MVKQKSAWIAINVRFSAHTCRNVLYTLFRSLWFFFMLSGMYLGADFLQQVGCVVKFYGSGEKFFTKIQPM